ncbi:MAG: hypothetical protein ABI876_04930, partial [Bacteroidota bacterium]
MIKHVFIMRFRTLSALSIAILATSILHAQPRAGLLWNHKPDITEELTAEDRSPYTLGTFAGIGGAFNKFSHYRIHDNGVVYREQEGNNLVYGVFALPSVNVGQIGAAKWPLSVILPMGVMKSSTGNTDGAFGIGLALGINIGANADVGIAVVGLFTAEEALSDPQKQSLATNTPLPGDVSKEISTQSVGSIT